MIITELIGLVLAFMLKNTNKEKRVDYRMKLATQLVVNKKRHSA